MRISINANTWEAAIDDRGHRRATHGNDRDEEIGRVSLAKQSLNWFKMCVYSAYSFKQYVSIKLTML